MTLTWPRCAGRLTLVRAGEDIVEATCPPCAVTLPVVVIQKPCPSTTTSRMASKDTQQSGSALASPWVRYSCHSTPARMADGLYERLVEVDVGKVSDFPSPSFAASWVSSSSSLIVTFGGALLDATFSASDSGLAIVTLSSSERSAFRVHFAEVSTDAGVMRGVYGLLRMVRRASSTRC